MLYEGEWEMLRFWLSLHIGSRCRTARVCGLRSAWALDTSLTSYYERSFQRVVEDTFRQTFCCARCKPPACDDKRKLSKLLKSGNILGTAHRGPQVDEPPCGAGTLPSTRSEAVRRGVDQRIGFCLKWLYLDFGSMLLWSRAAEQPLDLGPRPLEVVRFQGLGLPGPS